MRSGVTRFGTLVLSVAVAALCVLLPAAPAAAHNSLTGSDPRDGARLESAPKHVRLTFLARLDPGTTRVTVTGPDDNPVTVGRPAFSGSRVTVPVRPVAAGRYLVRYEVASGDGHPIKGDVEFTLTEAATPTAPPTTAPAPSTAAAPPVSVSPSAEPSGTPVAAPVTPTSGEDGGTPWWPWVLGAGVVLAALTGGLLLRRRPARGRPAD